MTGEVLRVPGVEWRLAGDGWRLATYMDGTVGHLVVAKQSSRRLSTRVNATQSGLKLRDVGHVGRYVASCRLKRNYLEFLKGDRHRKIV